MLYTYIYIYVSKSVYIYIYICIYIYIYTSVSESVCIYESGSRIPTPPPWYGPPPPYLIHFAHATVAKLTFPYFCMHAAVARRTFSFCWMNPLAGFGGSIARNCGEMQILSSRNCSAQCTGRFNAQQMESYRYIYIYISIYIHKHF